MQSRAFHLKEPGGSLLSLFRFGGVPRVVLIQAAISPSTIPCPPTSLSWGNLPQSWVRQGLRKVLGRPGNTVSNTGIVSYCVTWLLGSPWGSHHKVYKRRITMLKLIQCYMSTILWFKRNVLRPRIVSLLQVGWWENYSLLSAWALPGGQLDTDSVSPNFSGAEKRWHWLQQRF